MSLMVRGNGRWERNAGNLFEFNIMLNKCGGGTRAAAAPWLSTFPGSIYKTTLRFERTDAERRLQTLGRQNNCNEHFTLGIHTKTPRHVRTT